MRDKILVIRPFIWAVVFSLQAVLLQGCASVQPPHWIDRPPKGYTNEYFVGEGSADNRQDAKQSAIAKALARAAESQSVTVDTRLAVLNAVNTRSDSKAQASTEETTQVIREIAISGKSLRLNGMRVEEEYAAVSGSKSEVWVLMSAPRQAGIRKVPSRGSAVMRSVLFPGWGQYTMGYEAKGLLLGVTVVSSLPTALALKNAEKQNRRLAESTLIQQSRISYTNKANTFGSAASVAMAVAGASWVFGVVNATSAPFKLYVQAEPNERRMGVSLAWSGQGLIWPTGGIDRPRGDE